MNAAATTEDAIKNAYGPARERFREFGIDAEAALECAAALPISLHCWQADDVGGLEQAGSLAGSGVMATGNHPGRARTGDEIRADLARAAALIPGKLRANIHASYREPAGPAGDRDEIKVEEFRAWIEWARQQGLGLDFNPTFFAHPKAASGMTLAHADDAIRGFWVRHGIASRRVAAAIGRELGTPCVNNLWIPDGAKDSPADRWGPRQRLLRSLDAMYDAGLGIDPEWCIDAVEGKLFGLGCEDYTVGSMEFYSSYALSRGVMLCLDMGHFHPTESVADKISALLVFGGRLLLHVSRPLRWDSDHVVVYDDDLRALFQEVQRGAAWDRVFVALDFFDASINRLGAYVIGARATRLAILNAMLDPTAELQALEATGKGARKLALMDAWKAMPVGAVWDELCRRHKMPVGAGWVADMERYEREVLAARV